MGTSWSQEEVSGQNEQPTKGTSQSVGTTAEGAQITHAVKLPHNYGDILKDADPLLDRSSTDKLYDQLCAGVYLKEKRQKYWIDSNRRNCFMLFAKDLLITWAEDSFWQMNESGDVSHHWKLVKVCWLEVHGRFETAKCSPGTNYEVVFVVMLKDPANGWDVPVNLRLILPDGSRQEHKENLTEKQRGRWIEIPAGEFRASMENTGELEFSLYHKECGKWERGLVIKGVAIRPKP